MTSKQNSFSSRQDVASEFDRWAAAGRGDTMAAGHHYATQQLLDDFVIPDSAVVLDAGCGVGWIFNDLIGSRIARGVGIDLSAEMVAIASSRCTLSHVSFLTADSANTPFEDGQFSHIVSVESIYYTAQPLETLKEWLRITMPGGRLGLVIDLYRGNPASEYWVEALPITVHNLSVGEWQTLLTAAGWINVAYRCVSLPVQTTASDFTPSPYFPDHTLYLAYCAAGSLLLSAQKAD
ncbi:MAG: methyltransferase domain-containing protein [Symploca sp. SIO2G7]|nr:methyltransferase domain-containing protein [Symploca sp. SIO2G7]